jgi:hypothetical protein
MSALDRVASKTVENFKSVGGDVQAALDPSMIPVFANIIMEIIKMIQNCKKDADDAQKIISNPGFLQKALARRAVKNELDDRKAFRSHGKEMVSALLKTGAESTYDDIVELYDEV